jgi:hypothetical protein
MRRASSAGDLLGVAAVDPDGLLLAEDGVYVRAVEVGSVNSLALDPAEVERVADGFGQLAARLPDGQSLQLYAQGTPLALEDLLAQEAHRCEQAAGAAEHTGNPGLAAAIRQLGAGQQQSLESHAVRVRPLEIRYLVLCPWRPPRRPRPGRGGVLRVKHEAHERACRESLLHCEGVRADIEAMGLPARRLSGTELLDVLHRRFDPDHWLGGGLPASFLSPDAIAPIEAGEDAAAARQRAGRIAQAICTCPVDLSDREEVRLGQTLEQVFYVSRAPEQTWLGWLLHLMQAPCPFVLSVHVQATARYRERAAQKRRYKRIHGVNRGVEQHGRPLDPDALVQEEEAAELNAVLANSPGAGIYRMSVYCALQAPGPDRDREALKELTRASAREVTMVSDARIQHGLFAQRRLWQSTLPLGRDHAGRKRRYVSRNVGDTFPLCGTACSSPGGIPLGYALPGRTLVRVDPFDPEHPNHLLLINGMSGAGKTMGAIILLARAISQGATGSIIDRAGHFDFLCSLIPGAAALQVGSGAYAINSWDVPDPAKVTAEKVDYLLALHAQLLGEHHATRDSYGLTDLEANLLGLAINEVYARCALTGEEPRELLLQEELERRYQRERQEGSVGIAETLRNLSMRLNNYIGDGPYAYLADRPTSIPPGAPLVVFDTRSIPEAKAAAAFFVICEHVKDRIARTRQEHLAGHGARHAWAGRSFLVIDEAWKLIERPATGRWFNDFVRRSRHYALWLIAISQQLSDFDNEHGKALLANAAIRLFLRQEAIELAYALNELKLPKEAVEAIGALKTVKGDFSLGYLMNGTRGEGTVQIGVGPIERWIASSDPARDEPVRQLAIRQSDATPHDGWPAMDLLLDEDWQTNAATQLELPT